MKIFYTATVIVPDGSDSDVYGEPCETGYGETMTDGWYAPDRHRFEVSDNQDDVPADVYTPDDGPMIDWLAGRLSERLSSIESDGGNGTFYASDPDENLYTGARAFMAAHVYDAPENILRAAVLSLRFNRVIRY